MSTTIGLSRLLANQFTTLPYPVNYPELPLVGAIYEIDDFLFRKRFKFLGHLQKHFRLTLKPIHGDIASSLSSQKKREFKAVLEAPIKELLTFGAEFRKVKKVDIKLEGLTSDTLLLVDLINDNPALNDPKNNEIFKFIQEIKKRDINIDTSDLYFFESVLKAKAIKIELYDETGGKLEVEPKNLPSFISGAKLNVQFSVSNGDILLTDFPVNIGYIRRHISDLLPTTSPEVARVLSEGTVAKETDNGISGENLLWLASQTEQPEFDIHLS
jgi:hypothetical protein